MMALMLSLLLLVAGRTHAGTEEPLTPCDLVLHAEAYDGKTVRVRSPITIGPHDEYLVAVQCTPEMNGTDYIFLSYDESEPSVRALVRLLRKQSHRKLDTKVVATFSGTLETAQTGKFGAISAQKKLTIRHVERTSTQKK